MREPATRIRVASDLRFAIAHAFARAGVRFPTPELLVRVKPRPSDPVVAPEDHAGA